MTDTEFRIKNSEFIKSAFKKDHMIVDDLPQFVMAGKSNVGKSSFINSVLTRKKLAQTSRTPGKTRSVNYFSINSNSFYFVDLPGYGYAKVAKTERDSWKQMMESYFLDNDKIVCGFSLIDIRHEPSEADKGMVQMFTGYGISQIIILTKCDKVSKNHISKQKAHLEKIFQNDTVVDIVEYSSLKNINKEKVIQLIGSYL